MNEARIKHLAEVARNALNEYNAKVAAGGEMLFPAWARDLAELLDSHVLVVQALERAKVELAGQGNNIGYIDNALTKAGVPQK